MFLTMMVIGVVGLAVMAALGGRSHLPPAQGHGHEPGVGHHAAHAPGPIARDDSGAPHGPGPVDAAAMPAPRGKLVPATAGQGGGRTIPPPRMVFSVLALYGVFGNALLQAAHVSVGWAALLAIGPALLVERILIRPVWILLFRFRAGARRST